MICDNDSLPRVSESCHDLPYLPRELFSLVVDHLDPLDLIRCRRVSRAWNEAFTNTMVLIDCLEEHFPLARETRYIESHPETVPIGNLRQLFDQVVCKYYHLERVKPRSLRRYSLCDDFGPSGDREWFQVQPWSWHASHIREMVDHPIPEAMWTLEDDLLVFPSADHQCLVLLDLSNDRQFMVPFIIRGKVVRRVRLQKRLLVVEWAEPKAFHWLNDSDGVHRHFASSFDVIQKADGGWSIAPRNEWKIMFLGHPLSERDRFFSSHCNSHYVVYIWQPNRSLYTADEDAPIESLVVWDISKPSSYRPSSDPTGSQTGPEVAQAPSIVARFSFQDLEFYDIRQRGFPRLQRLDLTDDGQAIRFTENCAFVQDDEPRDSLGFPQTLITTIPVISIGPHRREPADGILPPYRGEFTQQLISDIDFDLSNKMWYSIVARVEDADTGLLFQLYLDTWATTGSNEPERIFLLTETCDTEIINRTWDFEGRGKIFGCDRYLLGENCNRELIIYRFDR